MKELSLSLLSRGCGRLVSSEKNPGRHDGRLDVCFTPQDYYIWKSQESWLRLSNSGRLHGGEQPALPKTYSTRRGPLLLYSQDLVTMETSCRSEAGNRLGTRQAVQRCSQQREEQLSTIRELTAAIINYSSNQCTPSHFAPSLCPPLHFPSPPDLHCRSPLPTRPTRAQPGPQVNSQQLPAGGQAKRVPTQPGEEEAVGSRNRVRLDVFLQVACASRTPTPQTQPQRWVHSAAVTPEEPADTRGDSLNHTESSVSKERSHHGTGEEHHPNIKPVHGRHSSAGRHSGTVGDAGHGEGSIGGNKHGRTGGVVKCLTGLDTQLHQQCVMNFPERSAARRRGRGREPETNATADLSLPPIDVGQSVCSGPCWGRTNRERTDRVRQQLNCPHAKARRESSDSAERRAQRLPPIAESQTAGSPGLIQDQTQRGARATSERDGFRLPPLHRQPPTRPLDLWEERPPPAGVTGGVAGWRGPGRQSSLAFSQDPCGSSDANRGVVRGLLPLELRDLQNGKSVGCLILGPDGEIIQLSLYDNSQDSPQGDDATRQQGTMALQVLSAEGETLPWVIVLQPDQRHTEEEAEMSSGVVVGTIQHSEEPTHRCELQRTESRVSSEQSFSKEQLLHIHSSANGNTSSPFSPKDTVAVAGGESSEAPTDTRRNPEKDAALRERRGEEEELHMTGPTGHLSGSQQPSREEHPYGDGAPGSQQGISPPAATSEETVDKRKKSVKEQEVEGAAVNTGKRSKKTAGGAESEGEKTSGIKKGEGRQRQEAEGSSQPIRSHKPGEGIREEASESRDQSVKRDTGDVMVNEERDEREGAAAAALRPEEESAGMRRMRKRRRGKTTHKEFVVGTSDDLVEEQEINQQEVIEEPSPNSNKTPPAAHKHNNNNKTSRKLGRGTETGRLSAGDEQRSVQSVSSLRSSDTAAAQSNVRNTRRSLTSSCGGAASASAIALSSGRLSSCSTVMVTDEQLMLNPVKPEASSPRMSQEEAAALRLAQRAERRRQEVERKRRQQEEEERRQQERVQLEERLRSELEAERRKRAEEQRLKREAEEEERRRREEEEQERARQEQAQRERERRRQEERRRQLEQLHRMREEKERRRRAELERLQLEEQRMREEENQKLQEMDERERMEYLCRKEQEEEDRRCREEESRRREEEVALRAAEGARLQAEQLAREMALLQRHLAFRRGLAVEAEGLEKTQGISRPWIYSYFSLLQLLHVTPTDADPMT